MKKLLTLFVMAVVFMLLPYSIKAVVELDENGNPITSEINEGEVRILSLPEDGNDYSNEEETEDIVKITSEDGEFHTTNDDSQTEEDNKVLYITLSSITGLAVGSIATYLFLTKKQ
mgnify:CR=1 FL=1